MQNVSKMPRTPVSVENFILPSKYAKNVCLSLLWVHWDVYKLVHNKSCCCCYVTSVVSDPVRPYRRQPTRLPHPWDSLGKNTGVGAISFCNAWKWKVKVKLLSRVQSSATPMDCSLPGSSIHGIFQARVLEWGASAFSENCHMTQQFHCLSYTLRKPKL